MADDKEKHPPKTDAEYRAYMNALIKKHTVCGELVLHPMRVRDLENLQGSECFEELLCMNPAANLESIKEAIIKSAEQFVGADKREVGLTARIMSTIGLANDSDIRFLINQQIGPEASRQRNALFKATDEVLGLRHYTPSKGEPKPDHGLTCITVAPEGNNTINDVLACRKTPINPRERR